MQGGSAERRDRASKLCPACGAAFGVDAQFCPNDGSPLRGDPAKPPVDPYLSRVILDHIELRELAGVGAMGRVYRAFQRGVDRDVAVKVLHRELSANEQLVSRFQREAKVASRLEHPNVVHVHLAGQLPDGAIYIVMEYLDGLSLQSALAAAGGAMELPRALHVALQICDAVGEGHAQGIVHRDLKPDNVMLVRRGSDPDFVKVLDFGIARLNWGEQSMATAAGLIFGTARYISPEGAQGEVVGPPADVYGITTLVYQLLAGRTPFEGEQAVGLLVQQIHDAPPPLRSLPRSAGVPEPISDVIMRNLAKAPAARASDARELGRALLEAARRSGLGPDVLGGHALSRSALPPPVARQAAARTLRQDEGDAEFSPQAASVALVGTDRTSTAPMDRVSIPTTTQPLVATPGLALPVAPTGLSGVAVTQYEATPAPPTRTQRSAPLPIVIAAVAAPPVVRVDRSSDARVASEANGPNEPDQPAGLERRRGRLRALVLVVGCFLLGGLAVAALAYREGALGGAADDRARSAWGARAQAAADARRWDAPPGENVVALTTGGLAKWPGDALLLSVRERAKSEILGAAESARVEGQRDEALRLLRIAHDLDPGDGPAGLLLRELASAPVVDAGGRSDAGPAAPRPTPSAAAPVQPRATLDFAPPKPVLGKPFELVARAFSSSGFPPKSPPADAEFVIAGAGLASPLRYPATVDAQGFARAAVMPLDAGRFEVSFSAKVDGAMVKVTKPLLLAAPPAPTPAPVTPKPTNDAGKWL